MLVKCFVLLIAIVFVKGDSYEKIDQYLTSHVSEEQPIQKNMDEAHKWLQTKSSSFSLSSFVHGRSRNLRQFVSLSSTIEKDKMCTLESYTILSDIDNAIGNRAHKPQVAFLKEVTSRIHQVVHHYHLEHANLCVNEYPRRFKKKFPTIPHRWDLLVKSIDGLATRAWYYKTEGLEYNLASRQLKHYTVDGQITAKALFNLLRTYNVGRDLDLVVLHIPVAPDSKTGAIKDMIAMLLERYIIDPCRDFVNSTNDIFLPADYDCKMGIAYMREEDRYDKRYHSYLARYRICRLLQQATAKRLSLHIVPFLKQKQKPQTYK